MALFHDSVIVAVLLTFACVYALNCSGTTTSDNFYYTNYANKSLRPATRFCRILGSGTPYVAGGTPAKQQEFPYMSAIGWPDNNNNNRTIYRFDCSGVLIHPNYVLTSAHCVYINDVPPAVILPGGRKWNGSLEKLHDIKDIIIHPKYDEDWPLYDDIALIQLKVPVLDEKLICLWSQYKLENNDLNIISYGDKKYDHNSSPLLLKAKQQIVSNTECNDHYEADSPMSYTVIDKQVCAKDSEKKKNRCQADFGGPLVLTKCWNTSQIPYVVGVKSFGNVCDAESPVVYSRVSEYLDWIEGTVWPIDLIVKNA